ncbi:MAG: V-type ATP synthase subunit A, partial [Bacillota bacterium]|nr:V-type ATP synthase subunit A [Bacillota bacterium]
PVTQNTKRYIRTFLALDRSLAYSRHYPAINWTTSYSDYVDDLSEWYEQNVDFDFLKLRERMTTILTEETRLMEIVKLIGADVLPDSQRLIIETARIIRLGYLQQNAYNAQDTYVPLPKQFLMMKLIIYFYDKASLIIQKSIPLSLLADTGIYDKLIRMKYDIPSENMQEFEALRLEIKETVKKIIEENTF